MKKNNIFLFITVIITFILCIDISIFLSEGNISIIPIAGIFLGMVFALIILVLPKNKIFQLIGFAIGICSLIINLFNWIATAIAEPSSLFRIFQNNGINMSYSQLASIISIFIIIIIYISLWINRSFSFIISSVLGIIIVSNSIYQYKFISSNHIMNEILIINGYYGFKLIAFGIIGITIIILGIYYYLSELIKKRNNFF